MPDTNQAQYEEKSTSNKTPAPTITYGQNVVNSASPRTVNSSDSGTYVKPPEPVLGPTKPNTGSSEDLKEWYSVHPLQNPDVLPDLGAGQVQKQANELYQYQKNQPVQEEPIKLLPSEPNDTSGLVNIKASEFTKDGVTTSTVEVPAISFGPQTTREKLAAAEGSLQVRNMGGEAVSLIKVPFSGLKGTNPNEPLVQSTSLVDLLGVTPVGGGEVAKGVEGLVKGVVLKSTGKDLSGLTSKIIPAFKEDNLEVRSEKLGNTMQLTQGTEQEISLTHLIPENAPLQIERGEKAGNDFIPTSKIVKSNIDIGGGKTIEVAEKVPIGSVVKVTQPELPEGITLTRKVEGIEKTGETIVPHEPTNEEIANRYPLFGKGNNDLSDLTKAESFKGIAETENKPIFGTVEHEVPNLIDISKQTAKSGPSELSEAFVSEKQVAFTRSPSELEENKIIITGRPTPEIISTFGLKLVKGSKNVFISSDLTKGMKEYLLGAEKAGLITPRLSETHVQSIKDVLTNAKLYTKASREPKLFETYPEIVRPQVIGSREAYQMKKQILKGSDKSLRTFKKMQPFGPIKESKGVAGSAGKAKALLETKPEERVSSKPELFKTEKETVKNTELPFSVTGSTLTFETLRYPKGTPDKVLQSFRSSNELEDHASKIKTVLTEKTDLGQSSRSLSSLGILNKNIQDTLTTSKQSDKSISSLLTKTGQTNDQTTDILIGQSTDQTTGLITGQTTTQITTTKTPPNRPTRTTNNPPPNLILEQKKKYKQKKLKQRSKKDINFLGASTVNTVVGLTRREELEYGNKKTAKLLSKGNRLEKKGNFISYAEKLSKHTPTGLKNNTPTKLIIKKQKMPRF